jgi:large conductance mechanosensitive channel
MKKVVEEFKQFSVKGNVVDLAVGVIVGASFGKIISSLVNDILMPPIGIVAAGVNFKDIKIHLKDAVINANDKVIKEAVTINIGNFMQTVLDFLIVALCIFIFVKAINKFKRSNEVVEEPLLVEANKQELLLEEIRDILKNQNK